MKTYSKTNELAVKVAAVLCGLFIAAVAVYVVFFWTPNIHWDEKVYTHITGMWRRCTSYYHGGKYFQDGARNSHV